MLQRLAFEEPASRILAHCTITSQQADATVIEHLLQRGRGSEVLPLLQSPAAGRSRAQRLLLQGSSLRRRGTDLHVQAPA